MSVSAIEIKPSRVLPVIGTCFYGLALAIPWFLPWDNLKPVIAVAAFVTGVPFFYRLVCGRGPECQQINVFNENIISIRLSDGNVYPLSAFKPLRLSPFYVELSMTLAGGAKVQLHLFKDMLKNGHDMCRLRRVLIAAAKTSGTRARWQK